MKPWLIDGLYSIGNAWNKVKRWFGWRDASEYPFEPDDTCEDDMYPYCETCDGECDHDGNGCKILGY